jgi:hypothetical protein
MCHPWCGRKGANTGNAWRVTARLIEIKPCVDRPRRGNIKADPARRPERFFEADAGAVPSPAFC